MSHQEDFISQEDHFHDASTYEVGLLEEGWSGRRRRRRTLTEEKDPEKKERKTE